MLEFFDMIIVFFSSILSKLAKITFTDWNGGSFNYLTLVFGAIAITMVIGLFWKGARG